jgi:ubiquinone/menaquinone biosynthesis C-methylase UbiE
MRQLRRLDGFMGVCPGHSALVTLTMCVMAWYDFFASFYDTCLDGVYRLHREEARDALAVTPGMTVVDVGCGTGASFPFLAAAVGSSGRVIGADASAGMLRKAEARVRRNAWSNVTLLNVGEKHSREAQRVGPIDRVLCFLSLSVIPEWQAVLSEWYGALAPGGRLVIADVHNPHPGLYARGVEWVSRASLARESWCSLSELSSGFTLVKKPSSWVLGGQFFIASGTKP